MLDILSIIFGGILVSCIVVGAVSLTVLLFKAAFFNKKR